MTAVNVVLRPDAVHLLTDGAYYDPDGTLRSVQAKAHTVLHLNLAMAARGYNFFLWRLAAGMSERFATFDAAISGLPEAFTEALGYLEPKARELMNGAQYQLLLAGISERTGKPAAFAFFSRAEAGQPGRTVIPIDDGAILPCSPEFFGRLMDLRLDPTERGFHPERDGLRLLREQRKAIWPNPIGGNTARAIGGFAQITTVRRDGISTRILERWPDQIGAKIAA